MRISKKTACQFYICLLDSMLRAVYMQNVIRGIDMYCTNGIPLITNPHTTVTATLDYINQSNHFKIPTNHYGHNGINIADRLFVKLQSKDLNYHVKYDHEQRCFVVKGNDTIQQKAKEILSCVHKSSADGFILIPQVEVKEPMKIIFKQKEVGRNGLFYNPNHLAYIIQNAI